MSINRLPTDVLCNIFEHCDLSGLSVYQNAPLLLTRVCHRWRAVATGDPWLWTELMLDSTLVNQTQQLSDIITYYSLQPRLRPLPLSIVIDLRGKIRLQGLPDFLAVSQTLKTVMEQCHALSISCDRGAATSLALSLLENIEFSNLQLLGFKSISPNLSPIQKLHAPNLWQFFTNTFILSLKFPKPSLRSLIVSNLEISDGSTTAATNFLTLGEFTMLEELDVHCTVLQNARLPHVTLPHLKLMNLHLHTSGSQWLQFNYQLAAPSLQRLLTEPSKTSDLIIDLQDCKFPLLSHL